jgi:AcrR family transcriptional regulator
MLRTGLPRGVTGPVAEERSPMARTPAPGTRDRLLDTAARLFYDHGVHAVGLQQVIDECGCGKNLLYREFASKDDLIVAYLERNQGDWADRVERAIGPLAGDPAGQLVAIVRVAAEQVAAPGYRGCPFLNIHAEFPDATHPAHRLAVANYNAKRAQLRVLAERAAARDPAALTDRLMLILDGLYATGAILGGDSATAAVAFAEEIVRAATRSEPATASVGNRT